MERGMSGASVRGGRRCSLKSEYFCRISSRVFPAIGFLPVIISYAVTPKEKMSARSSTGWRAICSGARYNGVPDSFGSRLGFAPWDREVEIDQLRIIRLGHQDVFRLEVEVEKAALVDVGQGGGHAGQHLELIQAQVWVVAQDGFLQVRSFDVFNDRVAQAVELPAPVVPHDIRVVEMFHDLASPLELPEAAPMKAVLGKQHPQDEPLALPIRHQINGRHSTVVDLIKHREICKCRANHPAATVTNPAPLCKRKPHRRLASHGFADPGRQRPLRARGRRRSMPLVRSEVAFWSVSHQIQPGIDVDLFDHMRADQWIQRIVFHLLEV
jgi:hypothetical protein